VQAGTGIPARVAGERMEGAAHGSTRLTCSHTLVFLQLLRVWRIQVVVRSLHSNKHSESATLATSPLSNAHPSTRIASLRLRSQTTPDHNNPTGAAPNQVPGQAPQLTFCLAAAFLQLPVASLHSLQACCFPCKSHDHPIRPRFCS
jgi:hypothetical protein